MKKAIFAITFLLSGFYIMGQSKIHVAPNKPYNPNMNGIKNDSTKNDSTRSTQKLNTSVDYDISDLFNLDLTDAERAQAKAVIEVFTEQLKQDTNDIAAYINRGSYWATLGLHVQAIKDYNAALKIDNQQPIVYYNRALSKARFFYTYDACLDLKKSRDLGLQQAGKLLDQKCGRHKAKLNANNQATNATASATKKTN